MKKLFMTMLAGAMLAMMPSCGSKATTDATGDATADEQESPEMEAPEQSDAIFGNLPAIVAEAGQMQRDFKEEMEANASRMSDNELVQKMQDMDLAIKESAREAKAEAETLIGRTLQIGGETYDFIKFKEAVIEQVNVSNDCRVNVKIRFVPADGYTTDNIPANAKFCFLLTSEDNHVLLANLSYGKSAVTGISFGPSDEDPERWNALAKVMFLSEQDWNNIQKLK